MAPVQFFLFGLFLAWFVGSGKALAVMNAIKSPGNTGSNPTPAPPGQAFPTTSPNEPGTVSTPVQTPLPSGTVIHLPGGLDITVPGTGGVLNLPGGPGGGGLAGT